MILLEGENTRLLITGITASLDFPTFDAIQPNYAFFSADARTQIYDNFITIISIGDAVTTTTTATTSIPGFDLIFALFAIVFLRFSLQHKK